MLAGTSSLVIHFINLHDIILFSVVVLARDTAGQLAQHTCIQLGGLDVHSCLWGPGPPSVRAHPYIPQVSQVPDPALTPF